MLVRFGAWRAGGLERHSAWCHVLEPAGTPSGLVPVSRGVLERHRAWCHRMPEAGAASGTPSRLVTRCRALRSGTKRNDVPGEAAKWHQTGWGSRRIREVGRSAYTFPRSPDSNRMKKGRRPATTPPRRTFFFSYNPQLPMIRGERFVYLKTYGKPFGQRLWRARYPCHSAVNISSLALDQARLPTNLL